MGILDQMREKKQQGTGLLLPRDQEAQTRWPNLWELMTTYKLADGTARKPSAVRIWMGCKNWSVSISDDLCQMTLYASAESLAGAFDALEKRIADPSAEWRDWSKGANGKVTEGKPKK